MRFFSKIADIWRHEELRNKIGITLGLILVYRIGAHIALPGVDVLSLKNAAGSNNDFGLEGLLDLFTGGAFNNASIFALGIMPYISASIIIQLMSIAVPAVQKMQKEGESGRKKITQYTRLLTIAICLVQAPGYLLTQVQGRFTVDFLGLGEQLWLIASVLIIVCSTLVIMWLGERITEKGVGNGISLLIMIGIIARFPESIGNEFGHEDSNAFFSVIEIAALLIVIGVCVALVQAIRKVPVQMAKLQQGNGMIPTGGGARSFIPLKVNSSGVMPIIFAQAIMMVPLFFTASDAEQATSTFYKFMNSFTDFDGLGYNILFFLMVFAFTFFYTAITVNPNQMADDLKRQNSFVPGIKPGRPTAEFLDKVLSNITLPGALFLGIVAILPAIAKSVGLVHDDGFAIFFGGTSLLIMVGVILDTLQQIESYLLSRHYDGLMKSGKMRSRSQSPVGGLGG
ncbi:MAG: preprotein translocase subunit SecY [Crocinitomicaceae bacterium]|nr:preprotein translocase subunit SecY [Crocinitomicaceae bacterium]